MTMFSIITIVLSSDQDEASHNALEYRTDIKYYSLITAHSRGLHYRAFNLIDASKELVIFHIPGTKTVSDYFWLKRMMLWK